MSEQAPKNWVIDQLKTHELKYDYKTDSLRKNCEAIEETLAISFLRLDARDQDVEDIRGYIRDALNVYRHECAKEALVTLSGTLKYDPICTNNSVDTWVKAVCGENSNLDVIVIKHWLWQIKRKLAGLEVEHHLMPVLFGKSGAGKSVSVSKLIEPLRQVALQTDMTIFSDQFSRRAFARNFVVFFDELQGSDSADINAMKQIITAPAVEWRAMRSERIMSAPQNSTFIGCSNEPVRERIRDNTSSRRFWQLNCQDQIDWATINSIDYVALWRSIDESSPSPIFEHLSDIRRVQEAEIRNKCAVEQWLEEACEVVSFDDTAPTTSELYEAFQKSCIEQNEKSYPQLQKFARDLKNQSGRLGHGPLSKKTNRGTVWCIRVKACEAVSVDITDVDIQLAFDLKAA